MRFRSRTVHRASCSVFTHIMYIFLAPSSALKIQLVGKSRLKLCLVQCTLVNKLSNIQLIKISTVLGK